MTISQTLRIVWARRALSLTTLIATIGVTLLVSLLIPKEYTATTSIVVDVKADPVSGAFLPAIASPGYMTTQIDIIQSNRVADKVVKALRFDQNGEVYRRWQAETEGKIPIERYYGELLLKGLRITPARGSNVIQLAYVGPDPQFAAAICNAFAKAYIDVNVELRVEPAGQYVNWFEQQAKVLRSNLEGAQATLSAYQKAHEIIGTEDRMDQEISRLNDFSARLAAVQSDRADTSSRERNAGSEMSPDVQQSSIVQSLKSELTKSEARLDELSTSLGDRHPQRLQAAAQIARLREQLAAEMRRVSGGMATAGRVNAEKEQELRALFEAQKQRVLQLRSNRAELTVLTKDVENAQRAYETIVQRISQSGLESQSQQTNLHVLSAAVQPLSPSRPRIFLNLLAAVAGGMLLACLAALGMESLDRRIRSWRELAQVPDVPVLGVLRAEDAPSWRRRLARRLSESRLRGRSNPAIALEGRP